MDFREIARRLTGISTPFGGVSWNPPSESETTVVRRVIAHLGNHRVLFDPYDVEVPEHCISSIIQLRAYLTEELGRLDPKSHLAETLLAMRAACFKFLSQVASFGQRTGPRLRYENWDGPARWGFDQALGELRGTFGVLVADLAVRHKLDINEPLARILPADPDADPWPH